MTDHSCYICDAEVNEDAHTLKFELSFVAEMPVCDKCYSDFAPHA